jgi:hypothetical protein
MDKKSIKYRILFIVGANIVGGLLVWGFAALLAKLIAPSILSLGISALTTGLVLSALVLANSIFVFYSVTKFIAQIV